MHSKQPGPAAAAAPDGRSELGALTQPGRCRQHVAQAESRVRPLVRRAPRMERPARVRMRRRKPWVLARRRLFGWKVRLLTRRLLAFGTTGLRSFGRCVLPAAGRQKTRCSDIVPRLATNWLTAPQRTSAAAGDPSLGSHNFPRTRAKPFTVSRTVDNLDAGTQHRAVGDSTEPRYGAAVGAVKPARVPHGPVITDGSTAQFAGPAAMP